MRSPRECLRSLKLSPQGHLYPLYPLLEALVDAVEPEDAPCAEVGDWAEAQATIRKELAEIRFAERYWKEQCEEARNQVAEAKAEIERLRKERDGFRADLGEELRRRERLIRAKVSACDAKEAMRAAAELGRLVRNMAPGTSLTRLWGMPRYVAATRWQKGKYSDKRDTNACADPAEALRAIQKEVGDGEA